MSSEARFPIKPDVPWQLGNLPGESLARIIEPIPAARLILAAKRPLFILGSLWNYELPSGKLLIDYAIQIAKLSGMPVVAVSNSLSGLLERGFSPNAWMPLINIVDRLRDPEWKGILNQGQHDLVVFLGVKYEIASQGLSTLKHYAPYLRTLTLCRFYHPNATLSFPNLDESRWESQLSQLISELQARKSSKAQLAEFRQ